MAVIIIVVLLYIVVILCGFLPMAKKRGRKENVIYGVILVISFSVIFLNCLSVNIPGPSEPIKYIVEKLFLHSS